MQPEGSTVKQVLPCQPQETPLSPMPSISRDVVNKPLTRADFFNHSLAAVRSVRRGREPPMCEIFADTFDVYANVNYLWETQ